MKLSNFACYPEPVDAGTFIGSLFTPGSFYIGYRFFIVILLFSFSYVSLRVFFNKLRIFSNLA